MQIESGTDSCEGEEENIIELTITSGSNSGTGSELSILDLYSAVSACSNLHPDPGIGSDDPEDISSIGDDRIMFEGSVGYASGIVLPGNNAGDGGLPPSFPGSGGWITAENVGEYFDENGDWRSGLGLGAGTVREREDEDADEQVRTDQNTDDAGPGDHDEAKWRRTE
jgi:nucleotide-sensitive chloride channel 1A